MQELDAGLDTRAFRRTDVNHAANLLFLGTVVADDDLFPLDYRRRQPNQGAMGIHGQCFRCFRNGFTGEDSCRRA